MSIRPITRIMLTAFSAAAIPTALALGAEPNGPGAVDPEPAAPAPLQAAGNVPCRTVFGYLRAGGDYSHLHYDLLTHIACFSVILDSSGDGTFSNLRGWPWTDLINTAHANGVKIVLVVTLFDDNGIDSLVNDPVHKSTFFGNLKEQVLAGSADGVNIDFESNGYDPYWQLSIHQFMAELTSYLHGELPGCEVSYAALPWTWWYDVAGLAASCDYIFIMGYNYYTRYSRTSGPCAPLTGGSSNITECVDMEWSPVTQDTPEKLILGLPYYGNQWTTSTPDPYSPVISSGGAVYYQDEDSSYYGRLWDSTSQTPYYAFSDGTNWRQVWYDDATSLGLKYNLASSRNYRGIGMWALGYDGSRPELWNALQTFKSLGCLPAPGPIIDAVPDGQIYANSRYNYQLTLAQGAPPVVWSKTDGPAALTVDMNTGALGGWTPTTADVGSTVTIGVRALNGAGSDTRTWQVQVVQLPIPGDLNGDRHVDAADLQLFKACFTGSGISFSDPNCATRDLDGDGDVDQSDFGIFQVCISGTNQPADPHCAG